VSLTLFSKTFEKNPTLFVGKIKGKKVTDKEDCVQILWKNKDIITI